MLFKTHLVFSFLVGLLVLDYTELNLIGYFGVLLLSTLFIDIDTTRSILGGKLKILSYPVSKIFGHRKFIHSLLFLSSLSFIIWIFFDDYYIPFVIGGFSHLFLDSLTKQGINFLYPWQFEVKGFIQTGGFLEGVLFFLFSMLSLLLILVKVL
jgi:inner membrane protein